MTNQRQTVLVFIGITGLLIPMLVLVIAPIALVVAVGHTLNRLNTDSEIVVMNAAGMSPWRIFRPFLTTTLVVSVLVARRSAPIWRRRGCANCATGQPSVKADFVVNIVQPGRFITIERGLTFHIRERRTDGQLLGIFIDDRRDPNERATSLAEYGRDRRDGARHVPGADQRQRAAARRPASPIPTIVKFERYAFDLSRFTGGAAARQRFGVARAQSVGCGLPRSRTTRSTSRCRRISAPSCTTGSWRRSIRSPSRCCALRFSARRAPAGRAARCRSS